MSLKARCAARTSPANTAHASFASGYTFLPASSYRVLPYVKRLSVATIIPWSIVMPCGRLSRTAFSRPHGKQAATASVTVRSLVAGLEQQSVVLLLARGGARRVAHSRVAGHPGAIRPP